MGKFENLFAMTDKMGMNGMLTLWFSFYTTSFVVLLADGTAGPQRDFCMLSQLLCCTNLASLGYSVAHNVSWSKTNFYTMNFDTFGTLLAFAYFGGADVFGSNALGVWNGVQFAGTLMNVLFGVSSLYMVGNDPREFNKYLNGPPSVVVAV